METPKRLNWRPNEIHKVNPLHEDSSPTKVTTFQVNYETPDSNNSSQITLDSSFFSNLHLDSKWDYLTCSKLISQINLNSHINMKSLADEFHVDVKVYMPVDENISAKHLGRPRSRKNKGKFSDCPHLFYPNEYETWDEKQKKAWKRIPEKANDYFYNYLQPGIQNRGTCWNDKEKTEFLFCLRHYPPKGNWGFFSLHMPGHTGKQCESFYHTLSKEELLSTTCKVYVSQSDEDNEAGKKDIHQSVRHPIYEYTKKRLLHNDKKSNKKKVSMNIDEIPISSPISITTTPSTPQRINSCQESLSNISVNKKTIKSSSKQLKTIPTPPSTPITNHKEIAPSPSLSISPSSPLTAISSTIPIEEDIDSLDLQQDSLFHISPTPTDSPLSSPEVPTIHSLPSTPVNIQSLSIPIPQSAPHSSSNYIHNIQLSILSDNIQENQSLQTDSLLTQNTNLNITSNICTKTSASIHNTSVDSPHQSIPIIKTNPQTPVSKQIISFSPSTTPQSNAYISYNELHNSRACRSLFGNTPERKDKQTNNENNSPERLYSLNKEVEIGKDIKIIHENQLETEINKSVNPIDKSVATLSIPSNNQTVSESIVGTTINISSSSSPSISSNISSNISSSTTTNITNITNTTTTTNNNNNTLPCDIPENKDTVKTPVIESPNTLNIFTFDSISDSSDSLSKTTQSNTLNIDNNQQDKTVINTMNKNKEINAKDINTITPVNSTIIINNPIVPLSNVTKNSMKTILQSPQIKKNNNHIETNKSDSNEISKKSLQSPRKLNKMKSPLVSPRVLQRKAIASSSVSSSSMKTTDIHNNSISSPNKSISQQTAPISPVSINKMIFNESKKNTVNQPIKSMKSSYDSNSNSNSISMKNISVSIDRVDTKKYNDINDDTIKNNNKGLVKHSLPEKIKTNTNSNLKRVSPTPIKSISTKKTSLSSSLPTSERSSIAIHKRHSKAISRRIILDTPSEEEIEKEIDSNLHIQTPSDTIQTVTKKSIPVESSNVSSDLPFSLPNPPSELTLPRGTIIPIESLKSNKNDSMKTTIITSDINNNNNNNNNINNNINNSISVPSNKTIKEISKPVKEIPIYVFTKDITKEEEPIVHPQYTYTYRDEYVTTYHTENIIINHLLKKYSKEKQNLYLQIDNMIQRTKSQLKSIKRQTYNCCQLQCFYSSNKEMIQKSQQAECSHLIQELQSLYEHQRLFYLTELEQMNNKHQNIMNQFTKSLHLQQIELKTQEIPSFNCIQQFNH
ncbi:hypothetical protein WA158_002090 [Blastocystis sp. Blastoise]